MAWTANGTSAIITGSSPDVILAYSTTSRNFTQISNPTGVTGLGPVDWNPVSNYAIVTGSNGLIKYSDGGSLSLIPSASGIRFSGIDFNPNGTIALLGAGGGSFYKYTSATSALSLVTTLSGITQLQQVKFSRDGTYALVTAQSGSASDLYKFDGQTVYPISTRSNNTANQISFAPDDSYAMVTTTGGGLLTEYYNSNSGSLTTIAPRYKAARHRFYPDSNGRHHHDHNIIFNDFILTGVHLDPTECRTVHCRNTYQPLRKNSPKTRAVQPYHYRRFTSGSMV